jgi:hypothetical protein
LAFVRSSCMRRFTSCTARSFSAGASLSSAHCA